tara:strand:+ start:76 stop:1551 length:1476 start_codon:yes stop_codon:yes gene_type:complete
MACKNCGKDKKKTAKKVKKKVKKKGKSEKHDLLYIMNPNCGWCKKADPVVEELVKEGYEITTLDITKPEQAERANEAKAKYKAQCGTPLFLDAETGNMACGFREKDVLEKWAKGEEMPAPAPRPERPQQGQQPNTGPQQHKLEYFWLDGNGTKNIRSKVRYIKMRPNQRLQPQSIPEWGFDGSSTNQAETENSDCVLKPVRVWKNNFESRQIPSYYVLCEVMNPDGTPHESNTRRKLMEAWTNPDSMEEQYMIGIEQEYTLVDPQTKKPLGWDKYENDTPPPQGEYYCGVGAEVNISRNIAEAHANACILNDVKFEGYHPEVMLSQWEYQIGICSPLDAADQLWMSRFLLQRTGEIMNIAISYDPKPADGDWNGSGAHINFSNKKMREDEDLGYINFICASLQESHNESISAYGEGNDRRLTGKHETSSFDTFTWGESDRSASIRIPLSTTKEGRGYLEDRRPSANMDPYEALTYLISTVSNINREMLVTT